MPAGGGPDRPKKDVRVEDLGLLTADLREPPGMIGIVQHEVAAVRRLHVNDDLGVAIGCDVKSGPLGWGGLRPGREPRVRTNGRSREFGQRSRGCPRGFGQEDSVARIHVWPGPVAEQRLEIGPLGADREQYARHGPWVLVDVPLWV